MDGISAAASVITIVDASAKITSLCFQYLIAVKNARTDIERVSRKAGDITCVLLQIENLLNGQDAARLATTAGLSTALIRCLKELTELESKLELGKNRRPIRPFGMRSLQWPFTSTQVDKVVSGLEGYERTFTLALQVDQTGLTLGLDRKLTLVADDTQVIRQRIDLINLPIATSASYSSYAEQHNAQCLPNTRTDLLQTIADWATDKDGKSIFWISGMAGTGKSTIARTAAQSLAKAGQLGASFLFKKGEGDRGNASRFFTTIATDLVSREPSMLPSIRQALNEDPALPERTLSDQFEKLILEPLSGIKQARSHGPARVIVIDALDECEAEKDIRVILKLLARTKDVQTVPLRVLVTSRPELHIRLGFQAMSNGTYQDMVLHEVPRSTIEHDIRLFLIHELDDIQRKRSLPSNWPSEDQLQALVELAVPLFIFAATVCRYVNTRGGSPVDNLDKVLKYQKSTFSQIDRTYLPVLDQLLSEQEEDGKDMWLQNFQAIVGSIVLLQSPLSLVALARLLQKPQNKVQFLLDELRSVLSIPDDETVPITLLHLSFRDFLVDSGPQGKKLFCIDEKSMHERLVSQCFELMSAPNGLRQDICGISKPGILRREIDEVTIASKLPPELQYACRYWVDHLEHSQRKIEDGDETHLFLQKHLLHWLEAMSLIKEASQCVHLVAKLRATVAPSSTTCTDFVHDISRFVLRFVSMLTDAPLQIYSSALVFSPEASVARRIFVEQVQPRVTMLFGWETDWDACRNVFEGHTDSISAVVFSPDGQLVASASDDRTVRLWETATGQCSSVLQGHTGYIHAVAFSPDGQLVASASYDKTVRLWETATGQCSSVLQGYTGYIRAVVFSPEGQLVASASDDSTVRLWETATGQCSSVLQGHTGYIRAVVFSPDRQLVASASDDSTVRLWETATGQCSRVLQGHTEDISAVAFSPHGQLVASASDDSTVRLWETATGQCSSVLQGHTGYISAVAFSPDGQLVASASGDSTVRLWETVTGQRSSVLQGHTEDISAVAFSPDGQLVASASYNSTVRLWETATGQCSSVLQGHTGYISAVAFSPDGQLVASASGDSTVRLWETATGQCSSVLQGHTGYIRAVVFSPDGQLVASASSDRTVRLWEIVTGQCSSVLQGHTGYIRAVAFSPDGQLVASASGDRTVRLWETATGQCSSVLESKVTFVDSLAFSHDGQALHTNSFYIPLPSSLITTTYIQQKYLPCVITVKDQWITNYGQRLLWLPSEFRSDTLAIHKDMVCLGYNHGRVVLLKLQ
ncbi:vegetative incompatibility protein HET-E-1 [Pyrenochaeta sp. MPI-SDFR-AT-0127]|nr:vegetative incompatibility protein HET-E-1 [Pyrenochaeta sp. MPI-SDFR-AT-0127]